MSYVEKKVKELKKVENYYLRNVIFNFRVGVKWLLLATLCGVIIGAFSSSFAWCLTKVTAYRMEHSYMLYGLPIGGLVIVALYHISQLNKDPGTNVLLAAVHNKDEDVPVMLAPLIYISSVITHACGGSAGREGAALQMGGSLGNTLGRILHLNERDRKILVMSGMSASFAAVFGTPLAAALFPMEMVSVGIMQYSALVPCVFSAFVASQFASSIGIDAEALVINHIPRINIMNSARVVILGVACAIVSILFCAIFRWVGSFYNKYVPNPYVKVVVGGVIFIACVTLLDARDFCGAGMNLVEKALEGEAHSYTFLLKIVLTAITLAAGYKGGEIVPAFCTGATFGCFFGALIGLPPSLCAAIGMVSLFCGVTNCPITSMIIGFELFGFAGAGFYLIAISVTYLFSGYKGLYREQIIMYSKYTPKYIHRFSGEDSFDGSDYED